MHANQRGAEQKLGPEIAIADGVDAVCGRPIEAERVGKRARVRERARLIIRQRSLKGRWEVGRRLIR